MQVKVLAKIIVGLSWLFSSMPSFGETPNIQTTVEYTQQDVWQVTYKSSVPIKQLVFVRSPDSSRTTRWTPVNHLQEIVIIDDVETIKNRDSTPFVQATFLLTPTYNNLPKDYTPFSPFSDGSMLFHSGRFFACANQCNEQNNQFAIKVRAAESDNIITKGQLWKGNAEWVDEGDGQKVYVGSQSILQSDDILAVIDPGLPDSLKKSLKKQLPEMMVYFSSKLGPLENVPMLFASYGEHQDDQYGHQGGTLPNQIFMHWYGAKSIQDIRDGEIQWFIAHEVAHLYQGKAANVDGNEHAWIHEGAAEYMAFLALNEQGDSEKKYANDTLSDHHKSCVKDTQTQPIQTYLEQGYFPILYHCGSAVWRAIESDFQMSSPGMDAFEVWKRYQKQQTVSGANIDTFIKTLEPLVSQQTLEVMKNISFSGANDFKALSR